MKMKEEKGVFSTRLRTDFGECDFLKRLKISAVLKYLAETSGLDYAQKGYPHRCLLEKGEVFLLTRISCRFHKDVGEEQPLCVTTFEVGTKGALFYRDFEIFTESGEKAISARTAWVLCDPVSRKILAPGSFERKIGGEVSRRADAPEPKKLHLPDHMQPALQYTVRYSDLDGNGHLYNARYADIAADALPFDLWKKSSVREFEINFQAEAKEGDILTVDTADTAWSAEGQKEVFVFGKIGETESFRCRFSFSSLSSPSMDQAEA